MVLQKLCAIFAVVAFVCANGSVCDTAPADVDDEVTLLSLHASVTQRVATTKSMQEPDETGEEPDETGEEPDASVQDHDIDDLSCDDAKDSLKHLLAVVEGLRGQTVSDEIVSDEVTEESLLQRPSWCRDCCSVNIMGVNYCGNPSSCSRSYYFHNCCETCWSHGYRPRR